jgi:protein disulfide-isomerase-like protein
MLAKLNEFDFFRKIPKDLTVQTAHGSALSICATIFMLLLFVLELLSFLSTNVVTNVIIDPNTESQLRINFNITTFDLPCEFATIDVVDILGTRDSNVTKNISKWKVDKDGKRKNYEGKNTQQRDLDHDKHHDIEQLLSNGVHAVPLNRENFDTWIKEHNYNFVDFYAPWCIWCQRLEPVWEAFAETVENEQLPVSIAKVDCEAERELCAKFKVQAFPTLKVIKNGEIQLPDYRSDRTVDAFLNFIKDKLSRDHQIAQLPPDERKKHEEDNAEKHDDHPGCMMAGFLLVNRVPGNFHIEARSKHHNLNPVMSNISHMINHLSFGPIISKRAERQLKMVPPEYFTLDSTHRMDGNVYINKNLHQVYHHYIKVISTSLEVGRYKGVNEILAYQMVASSQSMQYNEDEVPEARFSYDISPMAVDIETKGKKWYEFITSMCALIGGTFTVVGLLSNFLSVIFKEKKY